jgi:hypothetical protein
LTNKRYAAILLSPWPRVGSTGEVELKIERYRLIAVYKANIEAVPALQLQDDMALCYFAKEGNLRCVSLLLWAGAPPT